MIRTTLLGGAAMALGLAASGYAFAQNRVTPISTISGETRIEDTIEDIEERTADEFEESQDEARFGISGVPEGFRGSVFAAGSVSSGNTDNADVGIGARATLGQGAISHTFGFAFQYAEDGDDRSENRIFGIYDLNYDLTERFYLFGLARAQYDEFDSIEQDYFIGAGPGYRIFNRPDLAWRLQVGPGWRYTVDQDENDEGELAGIFSSRFYYEISPNAFVTNDTDMLFSDADFTVANDLALNASLAGPFSVRTALRTEYSSDPLPGFDNTDNELSAALVYSFR